LQTPAGLISYNTSTKLQPDLQLSVEKVKKNKNNSIIANQFIEE